MNSLTTTSLKAGVVTLLSLAFHALQAEIVITTDISTSVKVSEISSITFDGDFKSGNLQLNYADGTTSLMPVADIRKLTFKPDEAESAIGIVTEAPVISVSGDMLIVNSQGGQMAVCDMGGKQMMSASLSNGTNVFLLSSLNKGVYLLNVNGHNVKFIKQ